MKRVLIAGGLGYIGRALVSDFNAAGWQVDIIDPDYFDTFNSIGGLQIQCNLNINSLEDIPIMGEYDLTIVCCYEPQYLKLISAQKFSHIFSRLSNIKNCVFISEWSNYLFEKDSRGIKLENCVLDNDGTVLRIGEVCGSNVRTRFDNIVNSCLFNLIYNKN
ncbi:MAG: hypothetical protein AABY22_17315, partial [Nanoarchaeota archaeon]